MESRQTEQTFYREVDRARYRSHWGCLIWVIVLAALALGAAWYFLK